MRITKKIAENVAAKLTEKQKKKVDDLYEQFRQAVIDEYLKQVPKQILELWPTHRQWLWSTRYIRLHGYGFNYFTIQLKEYVPDTSSSSGHLQMNDKIADKLSKLKAKHEKANKEYEALKNEIEVALYNLRTYAKVQQHLPEAVPFLPASQTTALAINFVDIRSRLKLAS